MDVAVTQDVSNLCGLQQRVDWHENATGACRTEHRHDCLGQLGQVDRDPFELAYPQRTRNGGSEAIDGLGQRGIVSGRILADKRTGVRGPICRPKGQFEE